MGEIQTRTFNKSGRLIETPQVDSCYFQQFATFWCFFLIFCWHIFFFASFRNAFISIFLTALYKGSLFSERFFHHPKKYPEIFNLNSKYCWFSNFVEDGVGVRNGLRINHFYLFPFSGVLPLHQIWIINYYVKYSLGNLCNENKTLVFPEKWVHFGMKHLFSITEKWTRTKINNYLME